MARGNQKTTGIIIAVPISIWYYTSCGFSLAIAIDNNVPLHEMQEHLWEELKTMQNLIAEITKEQLRTDLPKFRPGDTVRVHVSIVEGTRERIQIFEGVVIKRRGGGISET